MDKLPRDFIQRMTDLHGQSAHEWLEGLAAIIRALEERWQIEVVAPFQPLSYNYVTLVRRRDGTAAILKIGPPGDAVDREAESLRLFAGEGAAYLLDHDSELGAILLERIHPGTNLKQLDEQQAVTAAVSVMQRIHRPSKTIPQFPTVQDWGKGFQRLRDLFAGGCGPLPFDLLAEAEETFTSLSSSMDSPVLLHGDLHHENILACERQTWVAIDPQGVIGEPAYEVGAFLRNPVPDLLNQSDLEGLLANRVALFSDLLGFDGRRLAGWGFAQAALSAIWSLEDHGSGWECALAVARAFQGLLSS